MALSQVQCLDDNNVNPRTHESKAEFFYCEEQRLALELLLRDGREAFAKYLEDRGLRGFLSDPELETLVAAVEPYDPGAELFPEGAEEGAPPLSLHYWPELSDTSVPRMDLGWPDSESYRGVTRTTVYTQPPVDGQAHVKEIVRKMIAQAQKVIAVVMDAFTDVDIFRDLLDAGFKRKVSVYILLEHTTLPHFLSMCRRANMHAGHLKHLRVRCTEGTKFHTRACTKVKGRMGHRFMFIDGDKAMSGSYSFTWMSSRLDRNLITVVTGQAADAFDRLFRLLYVTSSSVDLWQVATEPEPEPEPLPQPAALVLPSVAVARKLHNPKYALVTVTSPAPPAEHSSPKQPSNPENSKNPDDPETKRRRQKRASKEAVQNVPPPHPGLADLEKVCLIAYLPTWPEPDPPSDVIGFINIRDANRPTQVHLQRSEMFETSQAIRFSSPISVPKEVLPQVAKPRQLTAKPEDTNKLQPTRDKTKSGDPPVHSVQPAQFDDIKSDKKEAPEQKTEPAKETAALTSENNQPSSTLASRDLVHNAYIAAHEPPQNPSPHPNNQGPSYTTHTVSANGSKPEPLPGPNAKTDVESSLSTQTLESISMQSPQLHVPYGSSTEEHMQEVKVLQNSSEKTPNNQTPTVHSLNSTSSTSEMLSQSVISTSLSENNPFPVTRNITTNADAPLSSIVSSSILTARASLLSSTASSPLPAPVPKPRTVQLVIKHDGSSDGENLPEISVVMRSESLASTEPPVAHSEPDVAPEKQTLPELHSSKTGPQKDTDSTGNPEEAAQQKQNVASQETKGEEAVEPHDNKAEKQAQSHVLITDAPHADGGKMEDITPKEVDPKRSRQTDCKITSKTQTGQTAAIHSDTEASENTQTDCQTIRVPNEKNNYETPNNSHHHLRAQGPQRISLCETNPQGNCPLETVNSFRALVHSPVFTSHVSRDESKREENAFTSATHTDAMPNVIKPNLHTNAAPQESQQATKLRGGSHTPERPLRLHLSDSHTRDLRSPTTERELRSLTSPMRTPTPDHGFPLQTSTPDSRTHTPDPRSFTPDFRTSTPDVSDGYVSPREDSTLSTTSEEYYECSDSPSHVPGYECVGFCNQRAAEDHSSSVTTTCTSLACINNGAHATVVRTEDMHSSSSETQSLPGPVSASSSSVAEKKVNIRANNEDNGREEDEQGRNVAERGTEQDSQWTKKKGDKEDQLKQGRDLTEIVVEKDIVSQPQAPKREKAQNKSATESLLDGAATLAKTSAEGTDPKQVSFGGFKPDNVSSEGERPDKEVVVGTKAAPRPSSLDKRDRTQTNKESDGSKLLYPPAKLSQAHQQQQDSGLAFPSQPRRPPRLVSAVRPLGTRFRGSHQPNNAEGKVPPGSFQVLDNISSHRRTPSRAAPRLGAAGFAAEPKQAKISRSQQSLLFQQPLAAEGRSRAGQSQNEHSCVKAQLVQEEGRSPFTITLGRLYSLKRLKDTMSELPAQSKRGSSTGSPLQARKSTS